MTTKSHYFNKKYGMTPTHSAVVDAVEKYHVAPCKALEIGCGQGRNALYLALNGFKVTASDYNPAGIHQLATLAQQEQLDLITEVYDINQANIAQTYQLIVATVVFMFLNANRIPKIIKNMQDATEKGGYNLIVSAMDTQDYPCHMPFSFTFKENELKKYYHDWNLVEYREEIGSMHARDAQGKPIQLKFVTMLARK